MTTKSKLFFIFGGLFLLFFLFVLGSGVFFLFVNPMISGNRMAELHRKRTAETFGTITSLSQYRSKGDKYRGSTFNSTFGYQYVVNNVTYNGEKMSSGSNDDEKKRGLKVKVCYDPSDPKSSDFYYPEENKTCGVSKTEK
ncbi:MAG TPA: DUF3592 domain-containing protein [Pyrinomonadaceae bacterium]|nr:DUF3592 domain-containing protein [Pyrinomonadaceae bacterium]